MIRGFVKAGGWTCIIPCSTTHTHTLHQQYKQPHWSDCTVLPTTLRTVCPYHLGSILHHLTTLYKHKNRRKEEEHNTCVPTCEPSRLKMNNKTVSPRLNTTAEAGQGNLGTCLHNKNLPLAFPYI